MGSAVRSHFARLLAIVLLGPASPLLGSHGSGSHGGSHGGGSHSGGSHSGGSHHGGSRSGGSHGSRGGGRRGDGGSSRSHRSSHSGGDWIFFGAPGGVGLGWWYPDGGPYVEAPGEDLTGEEEPDLNEPQNDESDGTEDRAPAARALVTFSIEPDDAVVYIDGHLLGTAEEVGRTLRGVPVAPGKHTIAVERPGLTEWSTEIELAPGETKNIEVSLKR